MLNRREVFAMPNALTTRLNRGIMEILVQKKHRAEQMDSIKDKIHWETVPPVRKEERQKLSDSLCAMQPAGSKLGVS